MEPPRQTPLNTPSVSSTSETLQSQPPLPLTLAERKRKLATKLAIIGGVCVTAPMWGVIFYMAGADSAEYSTGAAKILPTIIGLIPMVAPVPGIALLVASLIIRRQAVRQMPAPPDATQTASASPAPSSTSARPTEPGLPWATPKRLFLLGLASFVLMIIIYYIGALRPVGYLFPMLGTVCLWTSIGCIGFSIIKALSNDKRPPRR